MVRPSILARFIPLVYVCVTSLRIKGPKATGQDQAGEDTTMRVLLLGDSGTGKSTLCQWLLAKTTVCEVQHAGFEGTKKVEYARGLWFDDPAMGSLEVIDTPGFKNTNEPDAVAWTQAIEGIAKIVPKIDAIILCVKSAPEADIVSEILSRARNLYGTDIWQNMMVYMRIDQGWSTTPDDKNYKEEDYQSHVAAWSQRLKDSEFSKSVTPWNDSAAKSLVEKEIEAIPYQGGMLVLDNYWGMLQAHKPSHADVASGVMNAEAKRMGLERLVVFRDYLLAKRHGRGEWDLKDLTPRLGPSVVTPSQSFQCSWPNTCSLDIKGTYMHNLDSLQVFPPDHTCGQLSSELYPVPTGYTKVQPQVNTSTTERTFLLGESSLLGKEKKVYKLCYCEYGACNMATHFLQDVGTLTLEPVMCTVPCPTSQDHYTLNSTNTDLYCGANTDKLLYSSTVQYDCSLGHGIGAQPDVKAFTRKCGINGELDPAQTCQPIMCEEPPSLGQAARVMPQVQGEQFFWQHKVEHKCTADHTTDGNPEGLAIFNIECGSDGKWFYTDAQDSTATAEFLQYGCRRWSASVWGDCSIACGSGISSRNVTCEPSGAQCDTFRQPAVSDICTSFAGCPDCGKAPAILNAGPLYFDEAIPVLDTEAHGLDYKCADGFSLTGKDDASVAYTRFTGICKAVPTGNNGEKEARLHFFKKGQHPSGNDALVELIEEPDFVQKGCRRWTMSEWSACSASCGAGFKSRKFVCSTGTDTDCVAGDQPQGVDLTMPCAGPSQCTVSADQAKFASQKGDAMASHPFSLLAFLVVGVSVVVR